MSPPTPLLVITPTLGRSPWLHRTVATVAMHAGARARHVLVAPPERLPGLSRLYPHCSVLPDTAGRGVYPAINLGLANPPDPSWKWATWLNDDDELTPGFGAHLDRALAHDGSSIGAPWLYGGVLLLNESGSSLGQLAVARFGSDIVPLAQASINPLNQQGLLAPRSWVDALGPLREDLKICADVDFWLRAAVAGATFTRSPGLVAKFRLRQGQISGDVESHRGEFSAVVQSVAPCRRTGLRHHFASLRFRAANAAVYAGRIRRVGFRSGLSLLEEPERGAN